MGIRVLFFPIAELVLARHRRAAKAALALVRCGILRGVRDAGMLALEESERIIQVCDLITLLVHYLHGRANAVDGQSVFIETVNTKRSGQLARSVLLQIDVQRRLLHIHFKHIHRQRCAVAENKIDGFSTDSQRTIDGHVPRHHVPFIVQLIIIAGQFRGVRADLLRAALADIHHAVGKDFDRPLHAAVIFADCGRVAALIHILVAAGQQLICRLT